MKRSQLTQLGETEIEVLQHVWSLQNATVADIRSCIQESRPIAYTTVMTVMKKLAVKEFLKYKTVGNSFMYSPARPQSNVQKALLNEIIGKVFQGSRFSLIRTLVSDESISQDELKELEELIASMKKEGS